MLKIQHYHHGQWQLAWETPDEALAREYCQRNRHYAPCRIQWESGATATWY